MDVDTDYLLHELNDSWIGLFLEDQWLQRASTVKLVKSLSERAPLLFFFDADEHGWGYRVFAGGSPFCGLQFQDYAPATLTITTKRRTWDVLKRINGHPAPHIRLGPLVPLASLNLLLGAARLVWPTHPMYLPNLPSQSKLAAPMSCRREGGAVG